MADRTGSSIQIGAAPEEVLGVIADFESYPEWAGAVKLAEIVDPGTGGRARRVRFALDAGAIRDTYVLEYDWSAMSPAGVGIVSWSLAESTMLKALDGRYDLAKAGTGTVVRYELSVDLRMPLLGMLRRKAEKVIIDTALNELKKRVEWD